MTTHPAPFSAKQSANSLLAATASITSRDIAELVGSRHDDVRRSIERLVKQGVIARPPTADVQEFGGNSRSYTTTMFLFSGEQGKRDSIILVAQLSPQFTARLVDRWMELEQQLALNTYDIPKTYAEALRLSADLAEKNQALEHHVQELTPKAEFHDAVAEATNCQTVQQVSKVFGIGPNKLFRFMREDKMLMQDNLPYQHHIDAGRFRVVERCFKDEHGERTTYTRTFVTGKGLTYIQRRLQASMPLMALQSPRPSLQTPNDGQWLRPHFGRNLEAPQNHATACQ